MNIDLLARVTIILCIFDVFIDATLHSGYLRFILKSNTLYISNGGITKCIDINLTIVDLAYS